MKHSLIILWLIDVLIDWLFVSLFDWLIRWGDAGADEEGHDWAEEEPEWWGQGEGTLLQDQRGAEGHHQKERGREDRAQQGPVWPPPEVQQ